MEKYTRKNNQFNPMSKEEFMKKEIERQREIEGNKTFKKFRVVVYEQKKSGGYPFADFETDNFYEGVSFAKKMMAQQKNYRADSEYLWVSIDEFQPIHERSNVIYPYKTMVHFGENDVMDSNFANGGGVGQVEHFTLDKDKLNEDAKFYADRIKSGQMSTTKKSIEERIEEYKKDLFLLEIGRKKPSNIIGTGYKGNVRKMANTWLLGEIYKDTKILELLGDSYSNGGGVGLTDKQKKIIDLNNNDIIDSEDFKLLRSSMNGAWRNEHKHVNNNQNHEVRYARKINTSRTGYKGKRNFADGGAVNLDFKNFTLNELSKSLPEDVSIMWLFQKKPEVFIRTSNKEWNKYASKHWTISDYGQLELTKGSENLYIDLKVFEASENAPEVEYYVTIYTKDNHNGLKEFSKNLIQKFAKGGAVEYLPVSQKISKQEQDEFLQYVNKFYGKNGLYADDLNGGFTKAELKTAINKYFSELNSASTWGYGDSFDRERVRQILQPSYTMFSNGGGFERLSNSVAERYEGNAVAPKYQRMYGKTYSKEEAMEVGDKVAGKMKAMQMQNKKAFGGFFDKVITKTKYPDLDDKQVKLKSGEYVQVVDQSDDILMVINLSQLGTGVRPRRINISEVDNTSFMSGGSIKSKLTLYKSNYLSTPKKQVLTSRDGNKIYIYENEVLYDSADGKTKGASHRMSKLELNILPLK
jgi:hypothetical protein